MAQNRCPERSTLTALSLGRLSEAELSKWGPHVETCGACQAALEQIERDGEPDRMKKRLKDASAADEATPKHFAANLRPPSHGKPTEIPAGTLFGEYELLGRLGGGGMGQVYKARHRRMNRVVALKIMSPDSMHDATAVKRFQREVQAAAQLEHPNIVTAHDAGEAEGVHFLVMQLVDGTDLSSLVKRDGPLSIERAVDYVCQAAAGLAYAHSEGVIHRDIKPANLLVDRRGIVKVLDLGLARLENVHGNEGLTGTEQVMGTVDYMSPEQSADTKHVDARADIYSLGCTLWYLLSGRRMYDGDTLVRRLMKHRDAPLPSLVKLREDATWPLEQVFHKMVAKQAKDRYATMAEVIAALAPYRGDAGRPETRTDFGMTEQSVELASFLQSIRGTSGGPSLAGSTLRPRTGASTTSEGAKAGGESGTDPQTQTLLNRIAKSHEPNASASSGAVREGAAAGRQRRMVAAGSAVVAVLAGSLLLLLLNRSREETGEPEAPRAATSGISRASEMARVPPPPAVAPFDAATARKHQEAWADYLDVPIEFTDGQGMQFVLIPPGEFLMGSPPEEIDRWVKIHEDSGFSREGVRRRDEGPQHRVIITRPYYLGRTEVTVAQYRRFVEATGYKTDAETDGKGGYRFDRELNKSVQNPAFTWRSPGRTPDDQEPVTNVTWADAVEFCQWASRQAGRQACYENHFTLGWISHSSDGYRLPTEAEWEFAARAGTTGPYSFPTTAALKADELRPFGWSMEQDPGRTPHPVALKKPNPFGLFDMHGNVSEYCCDRWRSYDNSTQVDPLAVHDEKTFVLRGQSGMGPYYQARSAVRAPAGNAQRGTDGGFRIVLGIPGYVGEFNQRLETIAGGAIATNVATGTATVPPAAELPTTVRLTDLSPDRTAAEWVLSLGGEVTVVQDGGGERICTRREDLPPAAFRLVRISKLSNVSQLRDTDFERLKNLRLLKQLHLEKVPITTAALRHLEASPLEDVALAETACGRDIVDWILARPALRALHVKKASLVDDDVRRLFGLKALEQLRLEDEALTDEAVRFALGAEKLTTLAIRSERLTDTGLRLMLADPRIWYVDVSSKQISDAGLDGIAATTHLRSLSLFHTSVTDDGVQRLRGHPALETLYLHDTKVTDRSIDVLASLPKLKLVIVGGSGVTAAGLHRLKQLRHGVDVEVRMGLAQASGEEASRNRAAAEWVVSVGGTLTILVADGAGVAARPVAKATELPAGDFLIDSVALIKLPQIQDADLLHLRDLTALRDLRVSDAPISAAGLRNLGTLPMLSVLHLSRTAVGRDATAWLSNQLRLGTLQIGDAPLTDSDVAKLARIPGLRGVAFYACHELTDDAVRALADHPNLSAVHVDSKRLTNEAVRILAEAPQVTSLRITSGAITDDAGPWLRRAERLTSIELYGTRIGDALVRQLEGMPNLNSLSVKQTRVTDACLDSLLKLPKLDYLVVGDGGITQAGVDRLRAVRPECEIKIEGKLAPAAK